jgi:hypothetical protein
VKVAILILAVSSWCAGQPVCPPAGPATRLRAEMCWAHLGVR